MAVCEKLLIGLASHISQLLTGAKMKTHQAHHRFHVARQSVILLLDKLSVPEQGGHMVRPLKPQ